MKAPSAAEAPAANGQQKLNLETEHFGKIPLFIIFFKQLPEKGTTKRRTFRKGDSISSLNLYEKWTFRRTLVANLMIEMQPLSLSKSRLIDICQPVFLFLHHKIDFVFNRLPGHGVLALSVTCFESVSNVRTQEPSIHSVRKARCPTTNFKSPSWVRNLH
jgi:hypothetical protein